MSPLGPPWPSMGTTATAPGVEGPQGPTEGPPQTTPPLRGRPRRPRTKRGRVVMETGKASRGPPRVIANPVLLMDKCH